ncbi:MAG: efflux RND transporter permease subunit [Coriobacteriia bacterium]|nr:efflux RND transporter permease subunit [Coriobacteriia bacterium]
MDRFTRFSLKNAAVVILVTVLLTAGGVYSAGQLKRETMPDVTIPIVAIVTPYPGAAPTDVQEKVTEPLEQAISQVDGIEQTSAMSNDSVSVVVAQFSYSANMDTAEADILKAMDTVDLPETAMTPTTNRVSMGSQPILRFAVSGDVSAEALQIAVRDSLVPALESVDGVGEVMVSNKYDENVRIVFDADKLDAEGLTAADVVQQLQAANLSFPVGSVEIDKIDAPIRVSGTLASVEDIRKFKVVIYPNQAEMMGDAFAAIGEGMGALGDAVGQLGVGVGQLGGAVGQIGTGVGELATGVGQMGQSLGMQIGLGSALQDVQAQSLEAKVALSSAQSVMRDMESAGTTDTPEYATAAATAAQLEMVIPALDQAAAGIQAQLLQAQKDAAAMASTGGSTLPAAPSGGISMSAPSGGSSSIASGDTGMAEPELGIVELGEIATVSYGAPEGVVGSRANGEPAVLINVVKTQDANTVDVSNAVQDVVDATLSELPKGTKATYTYEGAVMIEKSIDDMVQEGLLGALFAFLVILLFLRNWRSTLISAISIPLSIVLSLLAMKFAGVTMNVMTLGGLTVAIGRVVDDSIVVIENIFNHMQAGGERTVGMIQRATAEVSSAITSSTLTTVAVFAPMMLVSGVVGKIFTPFALTVAVALISSLLVSLTIVPLLAKWSLLSAKVHTRDEQATRSGIAYRRGLTWSLDHPGVVVSAAVVLFVASLGIVPIIGSGFMPPATEKYLQVDVEYPAGFTATDVDKALVLLETDVAKRDDVLFYTANVDTESGFNMASGGVSGGNKGHVFVKLTDDGDVDATLEGIQKTSKQISADGGKVTAAQVSMSGGSDSALELIVTGPMDRIEVAVDQITTALAGVKGLENVSSNLAEKRPQITAEVDQAAAASYGLNAAMVAGTIRGYVAEQSAGVTMIDDRETKLNYITALKNVTSAEDIAARPLSTPLGDEVTIGDVAHVEETATAVSVLTRDGMQYAGVSGSITDRDTSSVITAVEDKIASLDLPEGVDVEVGGVAQMMSESFTQLGIAMLVAVAAVYLVMVLTFGEAIAPLAIMFSLSLAVIGGLVGLLIAGIPLDMPAMIGSLMLIGIVTTNAIMFVERVHQRLGDGLTRREALLDAGANRMRPILMTALTTIIALVPMASGFKSGALMSQSLAIVVVGGLTTSTLLTLIVVPVIYDLLESLKERIIGSTRTTAAPLPAEE